MRLTQLTVLNEKEISSIHHASLKILSEVRIVVYSTNVLELLHHAGANVDFKEKTATIPASLVEKTLAAVPAKITLWNRNKQLAFTLGEERSYIANTEFLSGVVISQLVRKAAPIIYGIGSIDFNMREGNALYATPETAILKIVGIQLAKSYRILSNTMGFDTDSLYLDTQSTWETCLTGMNSLGAEADIIMDLGTYGTSLISSNEKLVIDNEILEMLYRFLQGVEISPETIAMDVIKKVGPRGNFLQEEHTLHYLRSGEHWEAEISNRCLYQIWLKRGSPDVVENATAEHL